jgi:hypothetical protein
VGHSPAEVPASVCDALLRDPSRTLARVAIPWLHVLSDHPASVARRQAVRGGRLLSRHGWVEAFRLMRTAGRAVGGAPGAWIERLPRSCDMVFVSHLVNEAHCEVEADFYFGSLARDLAQAGVSSVTLLRNHVRGAEGPLRRRAARDGDAARCVLPRVGLLSDEVRGLRAALHEARSLRAISRQGGNPHRAPAATMAASSALTEGTLAGLRLHTQLQAVFRRVRPRAVVVTYEGHAWERLAFDAARLVDPEVLCVGYQHTILFPGSHAVLRGLGRTLDPDVVLTIGEINRDRLMRELGPDGPRVVTYGSHRLSDAPVDREPSKRLACLVIPEGLPSECVILCELAWACAQALPEVEFRVRFHPVFTYEDLVRRHPRFATRPANVSISAGASVREDATACRWALYRGSSAVLQAVLSGVRPLYFVGPDGNEIDPLFGMSEWRHRVRSPEDVVTIVEQDGLFGPEQWNSLGAVGRTFCERYIRPVEFSVVLDLLPCEAKPTRC